MPLRTGSSPSCRSEASCRHDAGARGGVRLRGILTLIGTSANLLVNSLMVGQGMPALKIFDLFPVGILIVLACGATIVATYPRLLKARAARNDNASNYFLEARLAPGSGLVGRSVQDCRLRKPGVPTRRWPSCCR
jgi:di/tricarboxylate transporter